MASMLLAASCLSTSTVFPEATTDSLFWIISDPPSLTAWEAAEQWCNSAVALSWPCIAVGNWKKDYIECMVVGCCNNQQSPFHYSQSGFLVVIVLMCHGHFLVEQMNNAWIYAAVLWENFSYPNSNNWKKILPLFYPYPVQYSETE